MSSQQRQFPWRRDQMKLPKKHHPSDPQKQNKTTTHGIHQGVMGCGCTRYILVLILHDEPLLVLGRPGSRKFTEIVYWGRGPHPLQGSVSIPACLCNITTTTTGLVQENPTAVGRWTLECCAKKIRSMVNVPSRKTVEDLSFQSGCLGYADLEKEKMRSPRNADLVPDRSQWPLQGIHPAFHKRDFKSFVQSTWMSVVRSVFLKCVQQRRAVWVQPRVEIAKYSLNISGIISSLPAACSQKHRETKKDFLRMGVMKARREDRHNAPGKMNKNMKVAANASPVPRVSVVQVVLMTKMRMPSRVVG